MPSPTRAMMVSSVAPPTNRSRFERTVTRARTFTPMNVWDMRLNAHHRVTIPLPEGHTTALFVLKGAIRLGDRHTVRTAELAVMERRGTELVMEVEEETTLLLLNGAPLNEPIVGHGPFVMNTQEEIMQAINDYNSGRFGQIGR